MLSIYWLQVHFNSHPHEEDDNWNISNKCNVRYFNSHPHEEDDSSSSATAKSFGNFNSHPHEEDDVGTFQINAMLDISTHILTKRMTVNEGVSSLKNEISTHILTKRMTWVEEYQAKNGIHFNSHPHEEDDAN